MRRLHQWLPSGGAEFGRFVLHVVLGALLGTVRGAVSGVFGGQAWVNRTVFEVI
jgi:hypothetical protein